MTSAREQPLGSGGYERSDARVRPLLIFGFALALLLSAALGVSAWLSQGWTDELRDEPVNPMRAALAPPPGPALQAVPSLELAEKRAWEEHVLNSTEWVDPLNGIVRIPIDQALELALEEGFPTRPPAEDGK